MADLNDLILRYSLDLVYPGREAVRGRGTTQRGVILPSPAVWRLSLTMHVSADNDAQAIYDRLKGGATMAIDTGDDGMNLTRVASAVAATGQSLDDDALSLTIPTDDLARGMYGRYDGALVEITELSSGSIKVQPRPDVLPVQGSLSPPGNITVWMPELTGPGQRYGLAHGEVTLLLEVAE